jgi:hypothetical protein
MSMSMRKARRRGIRLMNRAEVFPTRDLCTGEYAGTWRVWRETREFRDAARGRCKHG